MSDNLEQEQSRKFQLLLKTKFLVHTFMSLTTVTKRRKTKQTNHHHVNLHVKTDCSLEVASKLFVTKCVCLDKSLILRMCLVDN